MLNSEERMRYFCNDCNCTITAAVYRYSVDRFGRALCLEHQRSQGTSANQPYYPKKRTSQAVRQPQSGMRKDYSCGKCGCTITEAEYGYSLKHFDRPLCREHQRESGPLAKETRYPKKATPQAITLYEALRKRRIKCELEVSDGYKSVDISIRWAKMDIEVDGKQHIYNPKQLLSDIKRSHWSEEDGYGTVHVSNSEIEQNVEGVADSIAEAARSRYYEGTDEEPDDGW